MVCVQVSSRVGFQVELFEHLPESRSRRLLVVELHARRRKLRDPSLGQGTDLSGRTRFHEIMRSLQIQPELRCRG